MGVPVKADMKAVIARAIARAIALARGPWRDGPAMALLNELISIEPPGTRPGSVGARFCLSRLEAGLLGQLSTVQQ